MHTVHAVALVVRRPGDPARLLTVMRPEDDDDLPGVWGLPATSLRPGEEEERAARRVGETKLGGGLRLGRRLSAGSQQRTAYLLRMTLYDAALAADPALPAPGRGVGGGTRYSAYRWAHPEALLPGAEQGSLCCRLLLGLHQQVDFPRDAHTTPVL